VVRTRTVVLQAHTHQFLGTFGGAGNGDYRGELLRALGVLTQYAKQVEIPLERILVCLDGLYGNAAPIFDVLTTRLGVIARHKDQYCEHKAKGGGRKDRKFQVWHNVRKKIKEGTFSCTDYGNWMSMTRYVNRSAQVY
jgi:hypothetical protein